MLILALLRHAKSSWDDPSQDDFDRALNERGLKTAPLAGKAVRDAGVKPGLIVCSSARRTRQTLDLALPAMALEAPPRIQFDDKLYLASPVTLMEIVRDLPGQHPCVLMIGHNPGLNVLAASLAGSGPEGDLEELDTHLPTAALAVLSIDRPRWRDVRAGDGRLTTFWTPKRAAGTKGGASD